MVCRVFHIVALFEFLAKLRKILVYAKESRINCFPFQIKTLTLQLKEMKSMEKLKDIRAIAFDADDTLWALQNYFEDVEHEYCELLSAYGKEKEISAALFETESRNMADLGYGCKAFTLSLVENAIRVSHGKVEANVIAQILDLGKSLLHLDAKPLEGVEATLARIREMRTGQEDGSSGERRYKLAVFTKGELMDQENKLWRSGLQRYFDVVSIVSDKKPEAYRRLCREMEVKPEELLMVGNSFKSDIAPALKIGASAVHIPFHTTWAHEKIEEFEHPNLRRISRFAQLLDIL